MCSEIVRKYSTSEGSFFYTSACSKLSDTWFILLILCVWLSDEGKQQGGLHQHHSLPVSAIKNKLPKSKSSSPLHTLKKLLLLFRTNKSLLRAARQRVFARARQRVCAGAHITLRSETSSLIDAVSEFGERDGGSGGRKIRRERGKQIKKRERAQEASIKRRNQIVFLAFGRFFPSSLHLPAPQFLIFSFTQSL